MIQVVVNVIPLEAMPIRRLLRRRKRIQREIRKTLGQR